MLANAKRGQVAENLREGIHRPCFAERNVLEIRYNTHNRATLRTPTHYCLIRAMTKITVLLADSEFDRFDAYCEAHGFKKSTLICRLIREYLEAENFQMQKALPLQSESSGKTSDT